MTETRPAALAVALADAVLALEDANRAKEAADDHYRYYPSDEHELAVIRAAAARFRAAADLVNARSAYRSGRS